MQEDYWGRLKCLNAHDTLLQLCFRKFSITCLLKKLFIFSSFSTLMKPKEMVLLKNISKCY